MNFKKRCLTAVVSCFMNTFISWAIVIAATATSDTENQLTDEEQALLSRTAPKIHLRCCSDIQKYNDRGINIVYIFGGPGSMKGLILEDLVTTYGFQVITGEEIILNYLPNRVANIVQYTQEIQDLVRDDPSLLQLDWVLNLMGAKLSTSTSRVFLVDLIPNLHVFLRVDQFMRNSVSQEMSIFCRRYPCLFALNLSVPEDKLVENAPGILMHRMPKPDDEEENTSPNSKAKAAGKEKEDANNNDAKSFDGSDEADTTRFQRRHQIYIRSVTPFLNFFVETNRLVTVDVVPRQREYVWKRVNEFFRDQGFGTHSTANTVVLFAFSEMDIDGLDPMYYKMLKVSLSSILSDAEDHKVPIEVAMRVISSYIHSASPGTNHLILLDCLSLDAEKDASPRNRQLAFIEVKECYLDTYIRVKSHVIASRPYKRLFKAISLTNNEVFIFPADTNSELCCKLALACAVPPSMSLPTSAGSGKRSQGPSSRAMKNKRSISIKTVG